MRLSVALVGAAAVLLAPRFAFWCSGGVVVWTALLVVSLACILLTGWIEIIGIVATMLGSGNKEHADGEWSFVSASAQSPRDSPPANTGGLRKTDDENEPATAVAPNEAKSSAEEGCWSQTMMAIGQYQEKAIETTRGKTVVLARSLAILTLTSMYVIQTVAVHYYSPYCGRNYYRSTDDTGFARVVRAYEDQLHDQAAAQQQASLWEARTDIDTLYEQAAATSKMLGVVAAMLFWRFLVVWDKVEEDREAVATTNPPPGFAQPTVSQRKGKASALSEWFVSAPPHHGSEVTGSQNFGTEESTGSVRTKAWKVLGWLFCRDGIFTRILVFVVACGMLRLGWIGFLVRQQTQHNPFLVLEIEPTADLKTIRKAFRRLSIRFHPD